MQHKDTKKLTKIQLETLEALKAYILQYNKAPTLGELAERLGFKSVQTAADRLTGLQRKGLIRRSPHGRRGIEILERSSFDGSSRMVSIPLVAFVGADQATVFAQQEYDQFLRVEERLLDGHRDIVAMRVRGSSMREAGIFDGDYIFVEPGEGAPYKNGEFVVAIVEEQTVVKEFYTNGRVIELRPRSKDPRYEPIIISSGREDFKIIGRVINVLHFSHESVGDDEGITIDPIKE